MIRSKVPVGGPDHMTASHDNRWSAAAWAVAGIAVLAAGGLFLPSVVQQFGMFPTLFLGSVIASCVCMQVGEFTYAEH